MEDCWRLCNWITLALLLSQGLRVHAGELHVSNLDAKCLRCLCYAATACRSPGCESGYCGPFYITRSYWAEVAPNTLLLLADDEQEKAWQECSLDYKCASQIITRYMKKYGRDCDGDGVTNCHDFASIHYNGAHACTSPFHRSTFGMRYFSCRDEGREEPRTSVDGTSVISR